MDRKGWFDPATWPLISGYLDQLLDLDPGERDPWLLQLAVSEPDMARVLRELLAEIDALDAEGFLLQPPSVRRVPDSLEGKRVGAYTLVRLLGHGGMGEVWLASRSDGLFEGRCAIKFLDTLGPRAKLEDRFLLEGRLLARLSHPNIAKLLDAGTTAEGRRFLVLEYIDGDRIDQYCIRRDLDTDARVELFLGVVSAVAHAHGNLIVHRDLKPANVLLSRDGTAKLLDFGIAKMLTSDTAIEEAATTTRVEDLALTPEYAAPEQLRGEVPSTATDVYQLGMLLYVLLTGAHPLRLCGSRAERIKAALESQLPRASETVHGSLRKTLRGDLDAILALALRREPGDRYATAAALHEDLQNYLSGQPVRARRGATLYAARKFVARHRITVVGSVIAVTGLCATSILAIHQARVAAAERDHAVALASRNQAVTEFMGTLITEAAESERPITVSEMLDRSVQLAIADTSGNAENRAAVLAMIAHRYSTLADDARAANLLDQALQLLHGSTDHALQSRLRCSRSESIVALGRHEEAVRAIEQELPRLESDPETAAYCMRARAGIAANDRDAEVAFSYATQALERFRASPHTAAADEGLFLAEVAWAHHLHGLNRQADAYYREALQKYDDLGRGEGPSAITLRNNWAVVMDQAGMPGRALPLYDEMLGIVTRRNPGSRPPAYLLGNRAAAMEHVGRFAEARNAYLQELEIGVAQQNVLVRSHALHGLASTAQEMGDRDAAGKYLEELSALLPPSLPQDAPQRTSVAIIRGLLYLDIGQFAAARAAFVHAIGSKSGGATPLNALLGKVEAELMTADIEAAANDARLALKLAISAQGNLPYSRTTGLAWLMLGRVLLASGQNAQARDALETALTHLSNTVDADHPAIRQTRQLLLKRQD